MEMLYKIMTNLLKVALFNNLHFFQLRYSRVVSLNLKNTTNVEYMTLGTYIIWSKDMLDRKTQNITVVW